MINHRPDGEGDTLEKPPAFFQFVRKGDAESHHSWHTCSYIFSLHVVKISDPGRLRSGHQVMTSDLTSEKSLDAHHSYNDRLMALELSAIDMCNSIYKMNVS